MSLFPDEKIVFDLKDAAIEYFPQFFSLEEATTFLEKLKTETHWQQDDIIVFGKTHPQPRLTCLYGNEGKPYGYSNIVMQPHMWTPLMMYIKDAVEKTVGVNFTTVLANFYRDGQDSNGWHADNEKELGRDPIIASVSFGAERAFQLKHNTLDIKQNIVLAHGSLLIMKGSTQHFWKHQIPKTKKETGPRINLTFRIIK